MWSSFSGQRLKASQHHPSQSSSPLPPPTLWTSCTDDWLSAALREVPAWHCGKWKARTSWHHPHSHTWQPFGKSLSCVASERHRSIKTENNGRLVDGLIHATSEFPILSPNIGSIDHFTFCTLRYTSVLHKAESLSNAHGSIMRLQLNVWSTPFCVIIQNSYCATLWCGAFAMLLNTHKIEWKVHVRLQSKAFSDLPTSVIGAKGNKDLWNEFLHIVWLNVINCQSLPAPISSKQMKLLCKQPRYGPCCTLHTHIPLFVWWFEMAAFDTNCCDHKAQPLLQSLGAKCF